MPNVPTTDHSKDSTLGNKSISGPGSCYYITPSDSADLPAVVRAIIVPEDGNIAVVPRDPVTGGGYETNGSIIFPVLAGQEIIGYFKKVFAAGTTAFSGRIIGQT